MIRICKLIFSKHGIPLLISLLGFSSAWAWTPVERAAIWTRAHDAIRERFVGFDDKSLAAWDANDDSVLQSLVTAPTDLAFWQQLRRTVSALGDGRTYVQLPNDLGRVLDTVPIRFIVAKDKVLVKQLGSLPEVLASGIHVGDELVEVDHVPVLDHLRDKCMGEVSGSSSSQRMAEATWRVLLGAADQPAQLVLRRPNGSEYSVTLPRTSGQNGEYMRALTKMEGRFAKQLPGSVIYMDIGQRLTANSEQLILDQLDNNPGANGLIFDLRDTKYGQVPWQVLERLALFPLPAGAAREVEWSSEVSTSDPGSISFQRKMKTDPPRMIQPSENPFRGRIVALVSAETAGPAEQFLEPLVFADRVALIGDTTAGAGGDAMQIDFGRGGRLFMSVRQPDWDQGYGYGHGFPPRIYVEPTAGGLASGKDEVLDRALVFIRERAN
jgi:C-terminal processing protease CtpA/Prc